MAVIRGDICDAAVVHCCSNESFDIKDPSCDLSGVTGTLNKASHHHEEGTLVTIPLTSILYIAWFKEIP